MPKDGFYDVDKDSDNVVESGLADGWADQSKYAYGPAVATGRAYRFGPVKNRWGTWGQLIYEGPSSLMKEDFSAPTAISLDMPANPAPDGQNWIQGHLINGQCGGFGKLRCNLVPISHSINMLHKVLEATLQFLINRGAASGFSQQIFNPDGIPNSRLIYRAQRCGPIEKRYASLLQTTHTHLSSDLPEGLVVSLGFVIDGQMQVEADVAAELDGIHGKEGPWFAPIMYKGEGKSHRHNILKMVGGVYMTYL